MAIDFKCTQCGKALNAQQQFAGRRTTCPNCRFKMFIPLEANLPVVAVAADPAKLDEKQEIAPDDAPEAQAGLKACPYCAEKIQAAARKCRHCHEYLDEDLRRADEERRRNVAVAAYRDAVHRNARMWRAASIVATGFTYTWLVFEALSYFWQYIIGGKIEPLPWVLIIFDMLLAYGLMRLTRVMRAAPASVFFIAAAAIISCGPLNVVLNASRYHVASSLSKEPGENFSAYFWATAFIGLFFSLPVWFTGLKLLALEHAARRAKKS